MRILKSKTCLEFVETAGNFCRRLGLPRSLGQIYGLLYLSPRALSLDEIADGLQVSKASVSTGSRQLATWGALRQVWVPGERRDYFEAVPEIGRIIKDLYTNLFKPRLAVSRQRFQQMLQEIETTDRESDLTVDERRHVSRRLQSLARLQERIQSVSGVLEKLI